MTSPMTADLASRYDGTALRAEVWGPPDGPVVVLVAGLGESVRSWGAVPDVLAGQHRVVAHDLRGHGESGPARSGDYELPAHAADLATVLAALVPAGVPYVVVGHSWGGAVILQHAAEGAPHLAGAVFVGSSGSAGTLFGVPGRSLPLRAQTGLRLLFVRLLHLGVVLRARPWARGLLDRAARFIFFGPEAPVEVVDEASRAFLATDHRVLAHTMVASVRDDYTRMATHLTAPSLVLWGERDRQDSRAKVRQLVDALPRAELVTLPGAGHMAPLTHSAAVADQVARWVRAASAEQHGTDRAGEAAR